MIPAPQIRTQTVRDRPVRDRRCDPQTPAEAGGPHVEQGSEEAVAVSGGLRRPARPRRDDAFNSHALNTDILEESLAMPMIKLGQAGLDRMEKRVQAEAGAGSGTAVPARSPVRS